MYKIIGADHRVYGPATAEQIRQWIGDGRANTRTLCEADGVPGWRPLAQFPEFADPLAAKYPAAAAGAPPPGLPTGPTPETIAAEIIRRGVDIGIGRSIGRGWDLLMANFWLLVGAYVLYWIAMMVAGAVPVAVLVFGAVLTGGLQWLMLKRLRGQPAEVGDTFAGFSLAFAPLMLVGIVSSLLTSIGFLLCLIPGIYLAVAWQFAALLAIDRKLDFWPALEVSRRVISHRWFSMLGLLIVLMLINLLGLLAFVIGLLLTVPLSVAAVVCAYEDVVGSRPESLLPGGLQPMNTPVPAPSSASATSPSESLEKVPAPTPALEPAVAVTQTESAGVAPTVSDSVEPPITSAPAAERVPAVPEPEPGPVAKPAEQTEPPVKTSAPGTLDGTKSALPS